MSNSSKRQVRRLFFPLRSSIEFFEDPTSVDAGARAKEGAVLFDEIVFEPGLLIANVGESGNFEIYQPADQIEESDLQGTRNPAATPGEGFVVAVGTERTPGGPAGPLRPILETNTIKAYSAEWHTSAIEELADLDVDWAGLDPLGTAEVQKLSPVINEANRAFRERRAETGLPFFQAEYAAKALARDAVVAARLGAAINVTSLFSPLLEQVTAGANPSGATALGIIVPDLGHLSWETVAEYREHPASDEARQKLREFEQFALEQEPGDADDLLRKVASSITNDLMVALADTEVNVAAAAASEAVKTAVSFIPIVGPLIGPAAGVAEALGLRAEQRAAWYFALMKLRPRS